LGGRAGYSVQGLQFLFFVWVGLAMTDFNKPTHVPKNVQEVADELYRVAWNSALEMAAYRIEHDFVNSFGKDTLSSIAIYLRGMKK
jgi:hypothetical protein